MSDLLAELQAVIRSTFLDSGLEIDRETTAADVPGWDSLSHVRLLMTIEQTFQIKFSPLEANRLKNVGDLADLIKAKRDA